MGNKQCKVKGCKEKRQPDYVYGSLKLRKKFSYCKEHNCKAYSNQCTNLGHKEIDGFCINHGCQLCKSLKYNGNESKFCETCRKKVYEGVYSCLDRKTGLKIKVI